jgi:hypothetical protein
VTAIFAVAAFLILHETHMAQRPTYVRDAHKNGHQLVLVALLLVV